MFPRNVLVFVLMTWSFSWISPERSPRWRKQIRRTLRTVKEIDANVKYIKEQFEGEESGMTFMSFNKGRPMLPYTYLKVLLHFT